MKTIHSSTFTKAGGILLALSLIFTAVACGGATATPASPGGAQSVWYVSTTGNDTSNDCHTAQSPCKTVQWVIDQAVDGDQVYIADGVYTGRVVIGDLDLTIEGSSPSTILENPYTGGQYTQYGGVIDIECDPCTSSVSISNLTVRKGIVVNGGGVAVKNVTLTMENVFIEDITAKESGGCLYVFPGTSVVLDQVTLDGCSAKTGGGIYNQGNLTISNSKIQNNTSSFNGGGLFNEGTLTISDSQIQNNNAHNYGGGVHNNGHLTMSNSQIRNNIVNKYGGFLGFGGGLSNYIHATATLTGSLVENNEAEERGGASITLAC